MLRLVCVASAFALLAGTLGMAFEPGGQPPWDRIGDLPDKYFDPAPGPTRHCPAEPAPRTIEIRQANPDVNRAQHDVQRATLFRELQIANRTIVLGPDVLLDFSDAPDLVPLFFGPCVTLTSAASFKPGKVFVPFDPGQPLEPIDNRRVRTVDVLEAADVLPAPGPARTPHSLGPLLRFGQHPDETEAAFLLIGCEANAQPNDHVRISGFRLQGPRLGQQGADQFGIFIHRCLDIEVSNMEIFGWGGAGLRVLDDGGHGPGQEAPNNRPGERIGRPEQVRIFNNYFHHNQHESEDESVDCDLSWDWAGAKWAWCEAFRQHAAGYGVDVHHGAWAQIYFNLFDVNRHAIAASGGMGGYDARWNLTLKGGGYHGRTFNKYTHQFDIHGTGGNGFGGQAGVQAWFFENSFQYTQGTGDQDPRPSAHRNQHRQ